MERNSCGQGAPLPAYDLLSEGLRHFPGDLRLRQLMALALARTGASRLARGILEELVAAGVTDEETLGLLARTCKDLWEESADPEVGGSSSRWPTTVTRRPTGRGAGYWSGINAATTALLLGDEAGSGVLAHGVRKRCLELRESAEPGEAYWIVATLGEASLLLRRWDEAEDWYREAAALGHGRWGNLGSTRRNARLILRALGGDGSRIEGCFTIPPVVAFSGHLVDRPDREPPDSPRRWRSRSGRPSSRIQDAWGLGSDTPPRAVEGISSSWRPYRSWGGRSRWCSPTIAPSSAPTVWTWSRGRTGEIAMIACWRPPRRSPRPRIAAWGPGRSPTSTGSSFWTDWPVSGPMPCPPTWCAWRCGTGARETGPGGRRRRWPTGAVQGGGWRWWIWRRSSTATVPHRGAARLSPRGGFNPGRPVPLPVAPGSRAGWRSAPAGAFEPGHRGAPLRGCPGVQPAHRGGAAPLRGALPGEGGAGDRGPGRPPSPHQYLGRRTLFRVPGVGRPGPSPWS
jgi:hypothetical protein